MGELTTHSTPNSDDGDDEGDAQNARVVDDAEKGRTDSSANSKGKNRRCHNIYTPNTIIVNEIMNI